MAQRKKKNWKLENHRIFAGSEAHMAEDFAQRCRDAFKHQKVEVRTFKRTVRAGGFTFGLVVVIARSEQRTPGRA